MIRPIDLQTTILSAQGAPAAQRAEDGTRLGVQAAQAAFAAELTHRDESVAPAGEVLGNRIGAKPKEGDPGHRGGRGHTSGSAFETDPEDPEAGDGEPHHIIDCTA